MIDLTDVQWVNGRTLEQGDPVHVYKNLHKDKLSIMSAKTRLVCAYGDSVLISNVRFHVSKSGRNRVLERNVRAVHAWAKGTLLMMNPIPLSEIIYSDYEMVYYNPFKTETFINVESGFEVWEAPAAVVVQHRVLIPKQPSNLLSNYRNSNFNQPKEESVSSVLDLMKFLAI